MRYDFLLFAAPEPEPRRRDAELIVDAIVPAAVSWGEYNMPGSADVVGVRMRNTTTARPRGIPEDDKALSEQAVRAIEEGRADHAAGRTFTLGEVKKDLGIAPGGPGCDRE